MSNLRRVVAPPSGDVSCFTMGLVFNGASPAAEKLIRQRTVVEGLVTTEIESRLQQGIISETLRTGALDYMIGDIRAADGLTTVDVTIWWRGRSPVVPA